MIEQGFSVLNPLVLLRVITHAGSAANADSAGIGNGLIGKKL
ncbi:unannotated protein [freshwater metagenome]|uniref:Unannotated protein n=1 Tax=freshwater metagenome TaxID=449393 RepID=A0A6J6Z3M1_9ZZZZ